MTHRASFSGPLSFLFRRVIGTAVERGMPKALDALIAKAGSLPT